MRINGLTFVDEEYYIMHNQNGKDTLTFTMYKNDKAYRELVPEAIVEADRIYKVKQIDDNGTYVTVDCDLDLKDWKTQIWKTIKYEAQTLSKIISEMLPDNWNIVGDIKTDAVSFDVNNCTPLDVIMECENQYGCYFVFDNIKKQVEVVYKDTVDFKGDYITDQLNIITSEYQSDTYDLVTRLYAYGKDDLTFASINGGKIYVDNFTYTDDLICGIMVDTSITSPNELLEKTKLALSQRCIPDDSYTFKIINLSKIDKNDFSLKHIKLHDKVKYIDRNRKREVYHLVVKFKEYPLNPSKDEITLSSISTTIEKVAITNSTNITNISNTALDSYSKSISYTDSAITNFKTLGNIYQDGNSIYIVDKLPKESATNVIRFDSTGIAMSNNGFSGTYITMLPIEQGTWTKGASEDIVINSNDGSTIIKYTLSITNGLITKITKG